MYHFVDRPVERLGNGGRFVLWAMRAWRRAQDGDACPRIAVSHGFAYVRALPALADFGRAMTAFVANAFAPSPVAAAAIDEQEAVLLQAWVDLAEGRLDWVTATLALILPAEAVAATAEAMIAAAAHLHAAGFDLSGLSPQAQKEVK